MKMKFQASALLIFLKYGRIATPLGQKKYIYIYIYI